MTREEAIKTLKGELNASLLIFGEKNDKETQDALKMAIEALKEQRPHGEWKKEPLTENTAWYVCSVCGDKVCCYGNNFCPNCGSPMNEKALEILRKREGE